MDVCLPLRVITLTLRSYRTVLWRSQQGSSDLSIAASFTCVPRVPCGWPSGSHDDRESPTICFCISSIQTLAGSVARLRSRVVVSYLETVYADEESIERQCTWPQARHVA